MTKFLCSECQIKVECSCNFESEKCDLFCPKCKKELSPTYEEWTREALIERIKYLIVQIEEKKSQGKLEEKQELPREK